MKMGNNNLNEYILYLKILNEEDIESKRVVMVLLSLRSHCLSLSHYLFLFFTLEVELKLHLFFLFSFSLSLYVYHTQTQSKITTTIKVKKISLFLSLSLYVSLSLLKKTGAATTGRLSSPAKTTKPSNI